MTPDYSKLPAHLQGPIERYVEKGIDPGRGLRMVLEHDLMAILAVDDETQKAMPELVKWIYNEVPSLCHGTRHSVSVWMGHEGRQGRRAA